MLEFNYWFFVLLANFLFLIWILNKLLFKPILNLFKEREKTIKSSMTDAKNLAQKQEQKSLKLNKELSDARHKAMKIFESLKEEGLIEHKKLFSKAENEAAEILQKARAELKAEAEKAKQALRVDVDKFSDEIVRKLIKA
ncbi:MAG: ATP synthase F0 subunit B [Nitrospiraceae bacterium]|nr:ATP synthase F0 subunit B [Nitrospiraceae bacterium]